MFGEFSGEVWSTFSLISGLPFGIILGADFGPNDSMTLTPFEAGWGIDVREGRPLNHPSNYAS